MKVLEINTVCGTGSTGRICTDLADLLAARGDTCRVTHGRDPVPEKYQQIAVRVGTNTDMKLHGVQTRLFDTHGFGSRRATMAFLDWVRSYDPDIIHLHNIHGYYLQVELLFDYLKQAGKPVVWTLHDCWPFTGHCAYYTAAGCGQWESGCRRCRNLRDYPACRGIARVDKNYTRKKKAFTGLSNLTVVTPSQWLAGEVKKSFLKEYPVRVIPNGIDLSVFKPTNSDFRMRHGLTNKTVLLGVANVWDARKGLSDLIALSELLDQSYQIVVVGLTTAQVKSLPPTVLGLERTGSARELAEIYSAADIFVNPTHEDNFPTTNLEALACGTPVVTYHTGGSPESVTENCGAVVPAGDVSAIAEAVRLTRWAKEACLEQAARYDKTRCFREYLSLYDEVMYHGTQL